MTSHPEVQFCGSGKAQNKTSEGVGRWLGFKRAMACLSEHGTGCEWDRAYSTDNSHDGSKRFNMHEICDPKQMLFQDA